MTRSPDPRLTAQVMSALPIWAKLLRGADRLAWYAYHAHEIVRDEALFAWLAPELRQALTVHSYSDMATYLPGGATYEAGLFPWERKLWNHPAIPRTGRVLLGAAGGGRELRALAEAGYEVVAFEPNAKLVAGARATAACFAGCRVVEASYADLARGAERGEGPLAEFRAVAFDWVLFGWGSFTHVTDLEQQAALLSAARVYAPSGPLALSFFLRRRDDEVPSRSRSFRRAVRSAFGILGGAPPPPVGLAYEFGGGFVYNFTEREIGVLALAAGYDVALFDDGSFPHAVLRPTSSVALRSASSP